MKKRRTADEVARLLRDVDRDLAREPVRRMDRL
jgi:hypothetical protein